MKLICKFKGCQWGAIEWATNYPPTHHLLSLLCCSFGMATVAVPVAAVPAICTHFNYLPALWQRDQSDKSHNYCALPFPSPAPAPIDYCGWPCWQCGSLLHEITIQPTNSANPLPPCLPGVMSLHALQFWFNLLPVPRQLPTLAKITHWIDNNLKFNCLLLY